MAIQECPRAGPTELEGLRHTWAGCTTQLHESDHRCLRLEPLYLGHSRGASVWFRPGGKLSNDDRRRSPVFLRCRNFEADASDVDRNAGRHCVVHLRDKQRHSPARNNYSERYLYEQHGCFMVVWG